MYNIAASRYCMYYDNLHVAWRKPVGLIILYFVLPLIVQVGFVSTVYDGSDGRIAVRSIRLTVDLHKCTGLSLL